MSHDQKSCDIYKGFNWNKQTSTTLELQPYHTMRPLSVDKLNIVISRLYSGQMTCQISSSTGFSIGTISNIHSEHFSDLPKSSGGYSVKLSPANVRHAVNFITSGKAETAVQVSKSGCKGPHPSYHQSCMHTQAHPKACSPIASQIHLQTLLYPQPVYHLAPLLPFSKPISCHLTQGH